ncbi:MAG: septum formation inhibitor Maf [Chlorobiota bacterium]|nr:septum formation inhibitor Maf [Chlorobiota bacterium]QQS66851.1 MAG: septum formation inhibitor Maf [Chlorobiota bacterium]
MKNSLLKFSFVILIVASTFLIPSCDSANGNSNKVIVDVSKDIIKSTSDDFQKYWYQGKAELNRYELTQARYGELRHGDAVAIFVTEDFLVDKKIKLESNPAGRENTSVLKLNLQKTFITGIYPYSLMSSVFMPVDRVKYPDVLKTVSSGQEWCGQIYTQMNLTKNGYHLNEHSYFEKEGDREIDLSKAIVEEALFTLIRISPQELPIGKINIIPSSLSRRLRHVEPKVHEANAILEKTSEGMKYSINYTTDSRSLTIDFLPSFPYTITGWSETYIDGFGSSAKELTTTARLTHTFMDNYWSHHSLADTVLRSKLGFK